jgi:DNA-binding transcriptional LysR family regulator
MNMDRLSVMITFVRVVETGSFSAAAREIMVGQPAVSKAIAQLEDRLGVRLLLRTTRRLVTTEAGRRFYEQSKLAVKQADRAEAIARGSQTELTGRLRISAPVTFARIQLIPKLSAFLQRHPKLHIDLILDDENVDLIGKAVDVALRLGNLADSTVVARKLAQTSQYVIGAPSYLALHDEPKTPEDLANHEFVLYTPSSYRAEYTFTGKPGPRSIVINGRLRITAAEGVRAAVISGIGLTIATDWMFLPELASGTVRLLLSEWNLPVVNLWAIFPSGRRTGSNAKAFVAFFESEFMSVSKQIR